MGSRRIKTFIAAASVLMGTAVSTAFAQVPGASMVPPEATLINIAQLGATSTMTFLLVWLITRAMPAQEAARVASAEKQNAAMIASQEKREREILEAEAKTSKEVKDDRHAAAQQLQSLTADFYHQIEREREVAEKHYTRFSDTLERSHSVVAIALTELQKSHALLAKAIESIGKQT